VALASTSMIPVTIIFYERNQPNFKQLFLPVALLPEALDDVILAIVDPFKMNLLLGTSLSENFYRKEEK
jgi:hypothetical protein